MAVKDSTERIGGSPEQDNTTMRKNEGNPEEDAEAQQDDVSSDIASRFLVNV
jgi:hypothetical protein